MGTTVFLVIGIFVLYGLFCYYIITHNTERRSSATKNFSQKRIKHLRTSVSERETRRKLAQITAVANLMRKVWVIGYSHDREEQIKLLLSATDKRDDSGRLITAEEIYIKQLTIAMVAIGIGVVLMPIMSPFTVVIAIALSPALMSIPLSSLKDEQIELSSAVSSQFLDFYKVYYVQFIRTDVTNTLSNVVQSYIPRASESFKKVLSRFVSDLDSGEEFALTQLDSRFPTNAKVHKFVTIAKARNKGDEACFDSMRAFLNEMEEQRDAFYEEDLAKREAQISRIVLIYLMSVFAVIMSVLIFNMVTSGT